MKGSDYLKEHRELIGLLGNTSKALRNEALDQTKELTKELMKNPTRQNALVLAKRGANNLGKRMTTRGNRLVRRGGNIMMPMTASQLASSNRMMGRGIFGDLVEDALVEGGKKLYKFDKEHGSHLKEGVKSGFKNMVSNFFKGGNGIESATRFGRGQMRFAVMPDVMPEYDPTNDVSGWIEKERRDTGYYGRPAILGEGM